MVDRDEVHAVLRSNSGAFREMREDLLAKHGQGFAVVRDGCLAGIFTTRRQAAAYAADAFADGLYSIHEFGRPYRVGSVGVAAASR